MTIERAVRILAGSFVLLSLVLFQFFGPVALLLAAFVGVNLIQSSFTRFCPAEKIFEKVGLRSGGCGSTPEAR